VNLAFFDRYASIAPVATSWVMDPAEVLEHEDSAPDDMVTKRRCLIIHDENNVGLTKQHKQCCFVETLMGIMV